MQIQAFIFNNTHNKQKADVLAESVGYNDDGSMDASLFAHIWERIEPVLELFRNEQIEFLWRKNSCRFVLFFFEEKRNLKLGVFFKKKFFFDSLLTDRATATAALSLPTNRKCIVLRISNTCN
jgi:hypothetical protein